MKIASILSKTHLIIDGNEMLLRQATKQEADLLFEGFTDQEGSYCLIPARPLPSDKETEG